MAWTNTRNDIIRRALRICGVIAVNQTPTALQYSTAADALNSIIEDLHNEGYRGSQIEKTSIACVDGTASYATGTDTMQVTMAYLNDGTSDLPPLTMITEEDYYGGIDDKTDEGEPEVIYIEDKEDPTVYLYPVPDSASYTLNYIRIKKVDSIDNSAESIDLEKSWWEAITYRLAENLCDEYSVNENKTRRIFSKADSLVKKAKKKDFYTKRGNNVSLGAYSNY